MVAGKEDGSSFQPQPGAAAGGDNAEQPWTAPPPRRVPRELWGSSRSSPAPLALPPQCCVREPGVRVPLSLSSLFHPRVGVRKVLSSALQPDLRGVLPQHWQPGLRGADPPSPALCPAAGWVKSLSLIPKLHHGCNSVDLSASSLCDFVSTKHRDVCILWVCAFKNKLCFFFFLNLSYPL